MASITSPESAMGPSPTSRTTPTTPSTRPVLLRGVNASPSQIAPQAALNQGVVALRMAM